MIALQHSASRHATAPHRLSLHHTAVHHSTSPQPTASELTARHFRTRLHAHTPRLQLSPRQLTSRNRKSVDDTPRLHFASPQHGSRQCAPRLHVSPRPHQPDSHHDKTRLHVTSVQSTPRLHGTPPDLVTLLGFISPHASPKPPRYTPLRPSPTLPRSASSTPGFRR